MEHVFHNMDDIEIYLDDIGIFSNSYEEHMATICAVLTRLQDNNFSVNPLKCEWAVKETDRHGTMERCSLLHLIACRRPIGPFVRFPCGGTHNTMNSIVLSWATSY
jgi:hypothetical protein